MELNEIIYTSYTSNTIRFGGIQGIPKYRRPALGEVLLDQRGAEEQPLAAELVRVDARSCSSPF